jgi:hypothetical protein
MANYGLFWLVYLLASSLFIAIIWHLIVFRRAVLLTYGIRAIAIAMLATPWPSHVDGPHLAPALMVLALDAITLGSDAALRAFVPLFLSVVLGLVVAAIVWLRERKRRGFAVK